MSVIERADWRDFAVCVKLITDRIDKNEKKNICGISEDK